MRKPGTVYIYALRDPRDGLVYYVGKTRHPSWRLQSHIEERGGNKAKRRWLDDLRQHGLTPEMAILEKADAYTWQDTERLWIAKGREQGWPLTNIRSGGESAEAAVPFTWFRNYVRPDLWTRFSGLRVAQREAICQAASLAFLDATEEARIRSRRREQVDWKLWDDLGFWTACAVTTEMLQTLA